ncbi:MAG: sodium:proton antiporter [Methylobacteriaceae bacterium]|jgi:Na+/H+ antiporter NhaD/arsenite permease-like protein|nr:sodium:proton antiporter [Methylobacteriaceae bacterium]
MKTRSIFSARLLCVVLLSLFPVPAFAAEHLDGTKLGGLWGLPFVGMLLSIALMPLFAGHFWEHHQGKIAFLWALIVAVPLFIFQGGGIAVYELAHIVLIDYIPFIVLLLALFTVAGGIVIRGNIHGSPKTNTALLAIGAVLASCIGTTGAAMVMIRPVMRANDNRVHNAHVIIFFIFLVANIGGSLTPLGDPPLFLGFLHGVDFFWTTTHLIRETLFVAILLLAVFFVFDTWYYKKEGVTKSDPTPDRKVQIVGGANFLLVAAIIGMILMSASIDIGAVTVLGVHIELINVLRDIGMIAVVFISLKLTPKENRVENDFTWGPILEVAKLFAGIFITIVPVLAILKAGTNGILAPMVSLVTAADGTPVNAAYFWLTGSLSSFLDNAPTYLVFFQLAGGDPQQLMTAGAHTLAAISTGAVYMGANTYIGNAPNFMVYAIARQGGVKMPSFFGYMMWSGLILLPVFLLVTLVFFI